MANRSDMGTLYARNMQHFGCGLAMYHPVSAADMRPPCVGYLDANRRWNHLTNIEWEGDDKMDSKVYQPLEKTPQKLAHLDIEWRPRTSLGIRQYVINAKGETPDVGIPAGADASIRYSSKTKFGAVLIAQKPVTLTSYNDETLFKRWIANNRDKLAELHGAELSRYGLWLITRTYTTQKISINAWQAKDKDASMSLKVKAHLMGDLGADVDWSEKGTDKDWAHYAGEEGVVAFFDGIEIPAWKWWYSMVKARLGRRDERTMILNRQALLPHGSWKPVKNIDPRGQSAPGADDIWVMSSPETFKQREIAPAADGNIPKQDTNRRRRRQDDADTGAVSEQHRANIDSWASSTPLLQSIPISRSLRKGRAQSVTFGSPFRNVSASNGFSKCLDLATLYPSRDITDPTMRLSIASTATGNDVSTIRDYAIDQAEN